MASSARIDEIKKKFDENPRRYFAPLANEFRKAGDLEQAIMICEEFLPEQAGHMSGHIVYAQALFESGRLPDARRVFETALGLDPENLIALRHLGDIARSEGDAPGARQWYDRVLEADPRNEEIQGLLAVLETESPRPARPATALPELVPAEDADIASALEVLTPQREPAAAAPAPVAPPAAAAVAPPAAAAPPPPAAPVDLAPIDLDMADFAPPAPASPPPAAAPAPRPAPDAADGFGSITLDGLEPTQAEAAASAPMPSATTGRAEGLELTEFEAPTQRTERASGLEPGEFEAPTTPPPRAEGLESTAFQVPTADVSSGSLLDLETSFAPGMGSVAPSAMPDLSALPGLEPTGAVPPPPREPSRMPSLDLDEELVTPEPAAASPAASTLGVLLGEAGVPDAGNPRMDPPAAMEAMPALELEMPAGFGEPAPSPEPLPPMMELTPAVIAAESQLMDAGEGYEPGPAIDEADAEPAGTQPTFVTETMAELYLKQGFREQALDVFRQLSAAAPHDDRLRARVAELETAAPAREEPALPGATVRDFLFRIAVRRPGELAAQGVLPAADDFAMPAPGTTIPASTAASEPASAAISGWESTQAPVPVFASPEPMPAFQADIEPLGEATDEPSVDLPWITDDAPVAAAAPPAPTAPPAVSEPGVVPPVTTGAAAAAAMPSATERGAAAQGGPPGGGSIDALFGNRMAGRSEDSAASALAQAFTGDNAIIAGRPARAAAQELSLDSVFRDGPPRPARTSQSFSFDQFFSESAATEPPAASAAEGARAGEPAERSADDIQQFNSWLQGLKQR